MHVTKQRGDHQSDHQPRDRISSLRISRHRDAAHHEQMSDDQPQSKYNPFESGLAHAPQNRALVAEVVAEEEAKQRAAAEAEAEAASARAAAEAAARPKPSGPSKSEFMALVRSTDDANARVGLLKGRAADVFKQGFCAEAAEWYTMAIEVQASHTLHSNRSACRCAHGDYEGALDDALAALRLSPSFAKGFARKGAALHGLCRFEESARAYEEGLKVDGSSAALQEGLVDALKRLKAAAGTWDVVVDGSRPVSHSPYGKLGSQLENLSFGRTRKVEVANEHAPTNYGPQLGFPLRPAENGVAPLAYLGAVPREGISHRILAADGTRPKVFDLRTGLVAREFNPMFKGSGAHTFEEVSRP